MNARFDMNLCVGLLCPHTQAHNYNNEKKNVKTNRINAPNQREVIT